MAGDTTRPMRLGAFLNASGHHIGSWRHPSAPPNSAFNLDHYVSMAQTAERGLFDLVFFADGLTVPPDPSYTNLYVSFFEPLALLATLAAKTTRIGLVATASTTFNEPFHIARKFASLDVLSGGRVGWNVVTSGSAHEAANFGVESLMDHDERYARAEEFVEVVEMLWDTWEQDAFIQDREKGIYCDTGKFHRTHHEGKYFRVEGALNAPPSPQGRPVIVQAGSSNVGRGLASGKADIVFTAQGSAAGAREFYSDIKARAASSGRNADHVKVMPGIMPYVGESRQEAQERFEELQDLIRVDVAIKQLSFLLGGIDLSKYPLDEPLQEIPADSSLKTIVDLVMADSRQGMPLGDVARKFVGSRSHFTAVGTASDVADIMEEWFKTGCCDGFNVLPPVAPLMLDRFVDGVVPELQRRGIFRTRYEGETLREITGLPRARNRYSEAPSQAKETEQAGTALR